MSVRHGFENNHISFIQIAFITFCLCLFSLELNGSPLEDSKYAPKIFEDGGLDIQALAFSNYKFEPESIESMHNQSIASGSWTKYLIPHFKISTRFIKEQFGAINFPFFKTFSNSNERLKAKNGFDSIEREVELKSMEIASTKKIQNIDTVRKTENHRRAFALLYLLAGAKNNSD